MAVKNIKDRVIVFPPEGKLIVSADIHGNKKDYLQIMEAYSKKIENNEDAYLLFLGDLIHGPKNIDCNKEQKSNYEDQSEFIIDHFRAMQEMFPERICTLLGNHEHGHCGGPHTQRYCSDEVTDLEQRIGENKTKEYIKFFSNLPLLAITSCGIVFSHGAPSPTVRNIEDVINVSYQMKKNIEVNEMYLVPILDLIWLRGSSDENCARFLKAVNLDSVQDNLVIYGHDIVEEGIAIEGPRHVILSTSFGLLDENKTYLEIDLSNRYTNTNSLKEKIEILKLWPNHKEINEEQFEFIKKAIKRKNYETAIFALSKAPDSYYKFQLLGECYLNRYPERNLDNLNKALGYFYNSLKEDHSQDRTHLLLANTHEVIAEIYHYKKDYTLAKENFRDAITHFRNANTYNPKNNTTYNHAKNRIELKLSLLS